MTEMWYVNKISNSMINSVILKNSSFCIMLFNEMCNWSDIKWSSVKNLTALKFLKLNFTLACNIEYIGHSDKNAVHLQYLIFKKPTIYIVFHNPLNS